MNPSSALVVTDPVYRPGNKMGPIDVFFTSIINEPRNLPFIHLMIRILLTTLPFSIVLFVPGVFRWWLGVPYFLFNSLFVMGPFILMQHNAVHKTLFKANYKFLNNIIPWILGPLFGLTPDTYFAHHVGMHHPENNLPPDLSTTMKSQRDSMGDFAKYFLRFFFFAIPELFFYLKQKNRKRLLRRMMTGEIVYFAIIMLLLFVNWQATLTVFLVPLVLTRFMMMAGNWAQHAFIDTGSPGTCYRNSITCINSSYNKKCFNDGYHIGHHLYPALHWTEMPDEFIRNIEKYKSEDALVFRKLDYFNIWLLLMTRRYKTLADFYVELNTEEPRSKEDVISMLKARTRKFTSPL